MVLFGKCYAKTENALKCKLGGIMDKLNIGDIVDVKFIGKIEGIEKRLGEVVYKITTDKPFGVFYGSILYVVPVETPENMEKIK